MSDNASATSVPERDGIHGWIPEDVYHADRGSLSVSGAKLLLPPSCPAKFRQAQDHPPAAKRIFEFGHLVHLLVLGKGVPTVEIQADNYRTKAAQQARDEARAAGKIPVLVGPEANDEFGAELAKAQAMTDAVFAHPVAGPLLLNRKNEVEQSLYATDSATGVRLRGRIDAMHFGDDGTLTLIDVKTSTTANPDELVRKFYGLNYFMQHAWYVDLLTALRLAMDPDFLFVVVEKDPPHLVSVVRYRDDALKEGRRRNRWAIDLYAECVKRGEWPGYADVVTHISLPRWASSEWAPVIGDIYAAPDHTTLNDLIEID